MPKRSNLFLKLPNTMPSNCWINYYSHSAYRLTNKMFASQALKEQNILANYSIFRNSFHIWSDPPETFFAGFKATVIAFATVTENNCLKINNRRKNSMISVFLQKCWNPLSVKTEWESTPSIDYDKSCMAKTIFSWTFFWPSTEGNQGTSFKKSLPWQHKHTHKSLWPN